MTQTLLMVLGGKMCSSGPRMAQTMLTVFRRQMCSSGSRMAQTMILVIGEKHHEETFSTSQLPIKEWFMISEGRSKCATQLTTLVAMVAKTILAVMLKNSYETF